MLFGTKNIIQFCRDGNCKLAHISTLSVGGFSNCTDIKCLDESLINVGQQFGNHVYMITKYKAECEVLKAFASNEISGKVFRLGNIMPRLKDGLFQNNKLDNAFISRLNTIKAIGVLPSEYLNMVIDISPVDLCAKSIITLLENSNLQTVYHIYNPYTLSIGRLLELLNINVKIVSSRECINAIEMQNNPLHAHLLNDLLNDTFVETAVSNERTVLLLNEYGFTWNQLDVKYLNYINKLTDL